MSFHLEIKDIDEFQYELWNEIRKSMPRKPSKFQENFEQDVDEVVKAVMKVLNK